MATTKVQRIMTQPIVRSSPLSLSLCFDTDVLFSLCIDVCVVVWERSPYQNLIFRFLQSKARIQIWLFEQKDLRIEGRIIVSEFLFCFEIVFVFISSMSEVSGLGFEFYGMDSVSETVTTITVTGGETT
ncbi:hypothetical protein GIB67_018632 [Kingdonia uniflora]|uniref:Uncharacterized protein n=1 Tax=Kingdonia uniflora TaxID=39325 RepID=A0A7J7M2Q0_9MAGN|nr:hypothetical protein GIB67_018632 [Kingdonia uniflora]